VLKLRTHFSPLSVLLGFAVTGSIPVRAADVLLDAVLKVQHFQQLTSSAPTVPATNGYSFQAFVVGSTNNLVTNATVRLPSGATRPLLPETSINLRYEEYFNTVGALDAAYPHSSFSGVTYRMIMQSVNDGVRSNNCAYISTVLDIVAQVLHYPATPQVVGANWNAAQQVDHTRGFTLQWNNLGGSTLDVVQVLVEQFETNIVYTSPLPFTTNALNGTSNSVTIPGYALPPGTNFNAHILVLHAAGIDTNNYATGVALLGKETVFPLKTRPAPAAPALELLARTNGATQLRLSGETHRVYQIQATENWTNWVTLLTTNPATGTFFHVDASPTNAIRFYRGRVGD
jgi:hypothetical protein